MLSNEFSLLAWGIDPDMDLLKLNPGEQVLQAMGQTLPFRSNTFKALFCECVLSLTPDMGAALVEFKRVLEPGGALVLCDIHVRGKKYCDELKNIPLACGFRQALERQNMQELVKDAGFKNLVWKDLSHLLTQLAGQAVFDHGSLSKFWAGVFGQECSSSIDTCETIRASRPGYFRIIARKGQKEYE
jgi:SAM-dependent methyltransferase